MNSPSRLFGVLVALVAACLFAPSAANASHIQGGSINAAIDANGHLTGTVTYLTTGSCVAGQTTMAMPNISVTNPSNTTLSIPTVTGTYTRCLPGSMTATGTFDVDLAALFGTATDGAYVVKATQSARVGGIVNDGGNGSSEFNTRVTKTGTTPSSSPLINSAVANAVAKGYAFKQNLNGVDPDGGPVTYVSRAGQSNGPSYDVVSISAASVVSMTAPQTDAFSNGQYFTYTVRVVDSTGDYSERDVLLTVTNTNIPPVIHGLSSTPIPFTAGVSQSVNFTADDADSGQTVSLALAAGAPAWVSLNATPGNPANATLTVNPPANLPAGTYAFNIDGVDSHSSVPLFASEPVEVVIGGAPAETTLTAKPNALTNSATAAFAFASDFNAATFECQLDAGAWAACTSPATSRTWPTVSTRSRSARSTPPPRPTRRRRATRGRSTPPLRPPRP